MELTHLSELNYQELRYERFDYLITTCGYQPRCHYLADNVHFNATGKFMLTIDETGNGEDRCKHMDILTKHGFKSYKASVDETQSVEKLLGDLCNQTHDHLNILIDYSCMPKKWYAAILDNITRNNFRSKNINIFLSYTPKIFEKKRPTLSARYFGPMVEEKDKLRHKKPITLIAALDTNGHLLQEAVNLIKPANLLAFVPNCRYDPDYTAAVLLSNRALLAKADGKNIHSYDVSHPDALNALLTSCCLDLRLESEILILPQGPKIFSMMALLLSLRYTDIKLWELTFKNGKSVSEQGLPASAPVVIKASFLDDEEDAWDDE